jgi:purine-cytosine permease-like protein
MEQLHLVVFHWKRQQLLYLLVTRLYARVALRASVLGFFPPAYFLDLLVSLLVIIVIPTVLLLIMTLVHALLLDTSLLLIIANRNFE